MNRTDLMAKVDEAAKNHSSYVEKNFIRVVDQAEYQSFIAGAQHIIDTELAPLEARLAEAEKIANDNATSCELLSQEIDRLREHLAEANKEIAVLNSRVQELIHMPQNEFQKQCLHEVSVALKISAESEAKLIEAQKELEDLQYKYERRQERHKTELAEAQKDSQRLYWIIKNRALINYDSFDSAYWVEVQGKHQGGRFSSFCEAIDAAMKERL